MFGSRRRSSCRGPERNAIVDGNAAEGGEGTDKGWARKRERKLENPCVASDDVFARIRAQWSLHLTVSNQQVSSKYTRQRCCRALCIRARARAILTSSPRSVRFASLHSGNPCRCSQCLESRLPRATCDGPLLSVATVIDVILCSFLWTCPWIYRYVADPVAASPTSQDGSRLHRYVSLQSWLLNIRPTTDRCHFYFCNGSSRHSRWHVDSTITRVSSLDMPISVGSV